MIALITIHRILNYGSALQAYATQMFIQKCGKECQIIDYRYPTFENKMRRYRSLPWQKALKLFFHFVKEDLRPTVIRKKTEFKKFWSEFLALSKSYHNNEDLKSINGKYSKYIVGSDQVWNTKTLLGDPAFLLSAVNDEYPKYAYASSFALEKLDERYESLFKESLLSFRHIGVREKSGLKILNKLGYGSKSHLVCDPTLLLDASDYITLAKRAKYNFEFDYIFVYAMVYSFNPNPALLNVVKNASRKYNCKVVFFSTSFSQYKDDHIDIMDGGPCDFINLISKAKYIVTSSFHGSVFSMIFRKPFTAITNRCGDARINDLLTQVRIDTCIAYPDEVNISINDNIYTIDVENALRQYIDNSKQYFKSKIIYDDRKY